ncbi:MAG: M28 family peptidase [Firmicutes bacterium]|nr:M28 family peptidase [Bacillota bacterium]
MKKVTDVEQNLINELSAKELMRHVEYFCQLDRTSASSGEFEAIDYIVAELKALGIPVDVHEFDAFLSFPQKASVEVLEQDCCSEHAKVEQVLRAKTRAFSGATPPEGVTGEVVYVPGGSDMFTDFDTKAKLEQSQLAGKVVMSEGGGRQNMLTAHKLGAVAYIHMWPSDEDVLHEGIVSPVWGTPTAATIDNIPDIPVVTITNADGEMIKQRIAQGKRCLLTVKAEVETGWRKLRMPEVRIPGKTDDFVLLGGHIDSWHLGATDNASGNATCLELAKFFWQHKDELQRGVRVAWWPGHSTGRYAGSTWYADNFWFDLHDHCVTYINIDSPGPLGATQYALVTAVAENSLFAQDIVEQLTGQRPAIERPVRAGDQSFWGPGVTSLFMLLSELPASEKASVGGSGGAWWWHTEYDTVDKVCPEVLLLDTQIHGLAAYRVCTAALVPLRLVDMAWELWSIVDQLADKAGDLPSLNQLNRELHHLHDLTGQLEKLRKQADSMTCEERRLFDSTINRAIKILTPINYTVNGMFDHDPAIPTPALPGLAPAAKLAELETEDSSAKFIKNGLVRQTNRARYAVRCATQVVEACLRHFA